VEDRRQPLGRRDAGATGKMIGISCCRRGRWLMACLLIAGAHLSAPPRAHALIQKLFSIKDIMEESQVIAEGKIERVDGSGQIAAIRVTGDIKGRCAYKEMKIHVGFGDPWHPAIMMKRLQADAPVLLFHRSRGTFAYNNREEGDGVYCIAYTGGVWFLACGIPRDRVEGVRGMVRENQLRLARTLGAEAPDLGKQVDDFQQSGDEIFWFFRHVELYFTRTYRGPTPELIAVVKDAHAGKRQPPSPDPAVPPLDLDSFRKEEAAGQPQLPGAPPALTAAANSDVPSWYEAYSRLVQGWGGPAELATPFALSHWVQGWGGPAELATPFTFAHGRVLRLNYPGAKHEKIAVRCALLADVSKARRLVFEALNMGGAPVRLAWAFKTDALRQYFEGPPVELAPGSWKYDLETDLTASHFKCAATDWQPRSRLITPERVVELILLIYNAPAEGSLTIGSVRLDTGGVFVRAIPLSWAENLCGVAWADYYGDGCLRACVCSPGQTRLYQNRGGEFVNVTLASGLRVGSRCAAWADYNGDGHPDLLTDGFHLFTYTEEGFRDDSKLLLPVGRVGNSTYQAAQPPPAAPGRAVASAAGWLDYNRDGLPDALVTDGETGLRLFENTGKGPEWFRDVSERAGLGPNGLGRGKIHALAFADYDGDGCTDVFCVAGGKGLLLHNEGGKGFKLNAVSGIEFPGGMDNPCGAAFADFNNDGLMDLFVSGQGWARLFRNNGDGAFTDVTGAAGGLAKITEPCVAAAWGDVNGDGNLDLLAGCPKAHARLFLGDGKGGFRSPDAPSGLGAFECLRGAKALSFADWDGDGDLDLLVAGEQGAAVLINACPREHDAAQGARAPIRVRLAAGACPGAAVRLRDDKDNAMGVRQLGLVQCGSAQEPSEAIFWVQPGAYKLSVMLTNGQVQEKNVTVAARGVTWAVPARKPDETK